MMLRHWCGWLVVSVIFTMSQPVQAQLADKIGSPDQEATPGDYNSLLRRPEVRKELKLTAEASKKVDATLAKVFGSSTTRGSKPSKSVPKKEPVEEKSREKRLADLEAELQTILSEDQWKRCVQLRLQMVGLGALNRPDIANALELSEAQRQEISSLRKKEMSEVMMAGFKLGFRPDLPSAAELKRSAEEKAKSTARYLEQGRQILTKDQQLKFDELLGPPFQFPVEVR